MACADRMLPLANVVKYGDYRQAENVRSRLGAETAVRGQR